MNKKKKFTYTCEDDNLNYERIEMYMKMSDEEREKRIKELEKRWAQLTDEEKEKECYNA